jgi:UDP-N-acetyl-D-galactosamine dehydrogenase
VLGLTFKENVVDIRNSQVVDIIRELWSFGTPVQVHDPLADPAEAAREYGITIQNDLAPADAVVLAVAHDSYRDSGWPLIRGLLKNGRGLVMDVKRILDPLERPDGIELWRL